MAFTKLTKDQTASINSSKNPVAVAIGRLGGLKGGAARAATLSATRRSEIAKIAATARWKAKQEKGTKIMSYRWSKTLATSDAQQKTKGSKMPFRFTKGDLHGTGNSWHNWFREVFFADADWKQSKSLRGNSVERAVIDFQVTILGQDHGIRKMCVNHRLPRKVNHSAPPTHLDFDTLTKQELESTNLKGHKIVFVVDRGHYFLLVE